VCKVARVVSATDTAAAKTFDAFAETLKRALRLTQKMLPLIADGSRIVNLPSVLARVAFPGTAAYATMKGVIEVLTRSLAKELGSRRITANAVAMSDRDRPQRGTFARQPGHPAHGEPSDSARTLLRRQRRQSDDRLIAFRR
jgi:NAD(P)-dependent dehydrogenase (short-subunit alcohol dehydrogenase family)